MADAARDKDEFVNAGSGLYKDNIAGDISAQDLRDLVESMHPAFASLNSTVQLDTICTLQNTWYKAGADGGSTSQVTVHRATHTSPGRLTYTGSPTVHAHIAASFSMTCSANNKVIGIGLGLNGVIQSQSEVQRKISTGTDIGSAAVHWDVPMATNDYLELFVRNVTGSGDTVSLPLAYLFFLGMFI